MGGHHSSPFRHLPAGRPRSDQAHARGPSCGPSRGPLRSEAVTVPVSSCRQAARSELCRYWRIVSESFPFRGRHGGEGLLQGSQAVRTKARETADSLTQGIKEAAQTTTRAVKARASELPSDVGHGLNRVLEQQKARGADAIRGLARAINAAAAEMQREAPLVARYVRDAAAGKVEALSGSIEGRNVNDLVRAACELARSQPMLFLRGAVAAGSCLPASSRAAPRKISLSIPAHQTCRRSDGEQGWGDGQIFSGGPTNGSTITVCSPSQQAWSSTACSPCFLASPHWCRCTVCLPAHRRSTTTSRR